MATISEALAAALQHHQAGRLPQAEQLYRQILQADPNHASALHLLGVLAGQVGKHELAVEYMARAIALQPNAAQLHSNMAKACLALRRLPEAVASGERAIALDPGIAEAHDNLGAALREQGRLDEAVACFRRALEIKPDFAAAADNLGNGLRKLGQLDEAIACFQRALKIKPDFAGAQSNLGLALKERGELAEATGCFQRALALKPDSAEILNNLGGALLDQGKTGEAVPCFRRAVSVKPAFAAAHDNLGTALREEGKADEAIACFVRAAELDPGLAAAHYHLGLALIELGQPDAAVAACRRALAMEPGYAAAYSVMGNVLKEQGQLDEAIACYRRALELQPDLAVARSSLIYTAIMAPGYDPEAFREEHRRWSGQFEAPWRHLRQPHTNEPDPERPLRIGYVSPDFRAHVVGANVLPILKRHDHARFLVYCYSNVKRPDALTPQFQATADAWREIAFRSDQDAADLIRADQIDILVDLTLHTAGNRLAVFARKPAPVQATWAGYPGTTGLDAMDYRVTDPHLDPPGLFDDCYSEESIRLPDFFLCYEPLESEIGITAPPAVGNGYITFGCLNNFCKVNPLVLKLWARVLRGVAGSRLTLLAGEGSHRQETVNRLTDEGISRDRVTFVPRRSRAQYLASYHGIDIGLDTIPYNGHTTSLDSTWMGVPVVTLVGSTVVGRSGLSQLTNLGLPELIATSPEQYVQIAVDLAQDWPRLSRLRSTLRERMRASPLMDAPRFTRNLEAAYRQMWRRWCAEQAARKSSFQ